MWAHLEVRDRYRASTPDRGVARSRCGFAAIIVRCKIVCHPSEVIVPMLFSTLPNDGNAQGSGSLVVAGSGGPLQLLSSRPLLLFTLLFAGVLLAVPGSARQSDRDPEASSPLGRLLFARLDDASNAEAFQLVRDARTAVDATRTDAQFRTAILDLGLALEGVWRYREAVSVYSRGLSRFSNDGELFLRRGTSSLRLRNFERALNDLRTAVKLLDSSFESHYRLGLAQFVTRDYRRAGKTMELAAARAADDEEMVAALHWAYASFKRSGRRSDSVAALEAIPRRPNVAEDSDYLALVKMYRGEVGEIDVFDQDAPEANRSSTRGFGVANWHLGAGSEVRAREILRVVVGGADWPAIGVVAGEVDLERLLQ